MYACQMLENLGFNNLYFIGGIDRYAIEVDQNHCKILNLYEFLYSLFYIC